MKNLLLIPLLVLGLAAAAPAIADDVAASISAGGFPATLSIQNGDTVTWKNNDTVNRQVVADDGTWKSPVLAPGASWSHAFVRGGTFGYHGAFKATQKGTVKVAFVRATLMHTNVQTVTITRAIRIQGQVSEIGSTGQMVTIQARPRGSSSWSDVAELSTKNQFFVGTLKPRRTTAYRAVWQNVPSNAHTVFVKPLVRIKQIGRSRIQVGVRADVKLLRHRVLLQRFNKRTHKWHSFTSVKLTRLRATMRLYESLGTIRLHLPHGAIIRALITRGQAGPSMYGPAWSRGRRL
jgi:plastocyanin